MYDVIDVMNFGYSAPVGVRVGHPAVYACTAGGTADVYLLSGAVRAYFRQISTIFWSSK